MAGSIAVREFEKIFCGDRTERLDTPCLSSQAYKNLRSAILDEESGEIGKVFSIRSKNGKEYIVAANYVGTVQTADGTTIDILPKIYTVPVGEGPDSEAQICGLKESKTVLLNMLRHFRDDSGISFQVANLESSSNFPILEIYISTYLKELERLLAHGIRNNYVPTEAKSNVLKGKLLMKQQVVQEAFDKSKFCVRYNAFLADIPQNRIIVSTLKLLEGVTHNSLNKTRIQSALARLDGICESQNVSRDIILSSDSNRLFSEYKLLLLWSELFLRNQSFTSFSGKYINQALLFPADKLFESFIVYLVKKYFSDDYEIYPQDNRHYLIEEHNGHSLFRIRPDIFLRRRDTADINLPGRIIIDTKWKRIDQNKVKGYNIDQHDLYQMYAYGKKYQDSDAVPKLILLYPYCDSFMATLPLFVYDVQEGSGNLKVMVSSFNLSVPGEYESLLRALINSSTTSG